MSADKRRVAVGSAEEWLRHARSDLALAYLGVEAEAVLIEQICFHA